MRSAVTERERRVLVAPQTRRGELARRVLEQAGVGVCVCRTLRELSEEMAHGAAAVLLTDDVLDSSDFTHVSEVLAHQPQWSDLPFVVLARNSIPSPSLSALQAAASVTVLERSVHTRTLASAVLAAVRARERQYQVRRLLLVERQLRIDADRANKAKDRFLAVLSHELRTPLTPIVFAVASLQRDISGYAPTRRALDTRMRHSLEMISRNVALETKLIDDMLDINRVVRGKLQLQSGVVDMHETLKDTLSMVESDARGKRLNLSTALGARSCHVRADGARMHQVLWNLAKNAIKFTPAGGTVAFRTWNEGSTLLISCSDDGMGINPEALPRIFEAFEQGGEEITRRFGGLGLGLTVSRSLVEAHGGTLTARSDGEGKGATFTIRLPQVIIETAASSARREQIPATAERHLNILLVEDHRDTADAVLDFLTSRGHHVRLVHAVNEALQAAARERCDVLISDINLPDGSGLELVERIEPRPALGAIAVSAFGMDADVRRSRAAGFAQHITKPIDVAHLEHALDRLAAHR